MDSLNRKWWNRRVVGPIKDLLLLGITPERIALSLAAGLVIGVSPALGCATLACTIVALAFRLNLVAIQAANYLAYPVQFLLLVPFLRGGQMLFRTRAAISVDQMIALMRHDRVLALRELWLVLLHATAVWAICAPFMVAGAYVLLLPIVRRTSRALNREDVNA